MKVVTVAVVLGGWLASASLAYGADRTAQQVLKEIDGIKVSTVDSEKKDKKSASEVKAREAAQKRSKLILELYKIAPDHKRIPALMEERWKLIGTPEKTRYAELIAELDKVVGQTKDEHLKIEAAYLRATLKLNPVSSKKMPDASGVESFLTLAPKDPRAGTLLRTATDAVKDEKTRTALLERLNKEYPEAAQVAGMFGPHNQTEAIGKPFVLEFENAISGEKISMKDLKGKVVVLDFWATWCPPCVAEMPKMKELYAKYREQGVEFIGVSLDQSKEEGGLASLKKFVKENAIAWPQYYQGDYWSSKFSKSWGINSIPCVFIVDADGNLFSTQARGKLEEMIPELLQKAKAKVAIK
jgi:thiol-disulfide isomerase/thioredoxin